jgi:hypothetical protein
MIIDISNLELDKGDVLNVTLQDDTKMHIKNIGDDKYQITGDVEKTIPSTETLKYVFSRLKKKIKSTTIKRSAAKSEYKSIMEDKI